MTTHKNILTRGLLLLPAVALMACGGDPSSAPPVSLDQGRLTGASASAGHVAIAVPVTEGVHTLNDVWVLSADAATLYKLRIDGTVQGSAAVTGKVFALNAATAAQAVTVANYSVRSEGAQLLSLNGLPTVSDVSALSLQHSGDQMPITLTANQATGQWKASQGDDVQVDWTVTGLTLQGSSTAGCSYSGNFTQVNGMAVYRVTFTETCGETVLQMSGIATIGTSGDRLTVVATDAGDTVATALLFEP